MHREFPGTFSPPLISKDPLVNDPDMHHGMCVTHVLWCMSGSLNCSVGDNVPGIPGTCAIRNFMYLVRGPWSAGWHSLIIATWCDTSSRAFVMKSYINNNRWLANVRYCFKLATCRQLNANSSCYTMNSRHDVVKLNTAMYTQWQIKIIDVLQRPDIWDHYIENQNDEEVYP